MGEDRALAPCLSCCPDIGWGNETNPVQLALFICPWKEGLCPLHQRQQPNRCSLRTCSIAWATWAAWELLPTPAGQRGHPPLGKMPPSKGDLGICRAPAALAGKCVLGRGAKAGSTRDLQDTATAQSMRGMCCILLLDTAVLCRWGMLPLSVLLSPSPA